MKKRPGQGLREQRSAFGNESPRHLRLTASGVGHAPDRIQQGAVLLSAADPSRFREAGSFLIAFSYSQFSLEAAGATLIGALF